MFWIGALSSDLQQRISPPSTEPPIPDDPVQKEENSDEAHYLGGSCRSFTKCWRQLNGIR